MCCGNCREQILLCFVGIIGNRYYCVLWELRGTDIVACCGSCREHIVLCVVGIVREQIM